ncbi:hypothetical protein N9N66_06825 [Schleiferiaceae bacterium]|nr:hypothetical protein [Schleiferiaceae bacterium]
MKNSLFILLFCAFYIGAQAQHSSLDRISIDGAVLPWFHTLNYSGTLNYEFVKTNHIGVYWKNWFEQTYWSGTGEREQSLGLIYTSNLIDKKWFLDIRFALVASQPREYWDKYEFDPFVGLCFGRNFGDHWGIGAQINGWTYYGLQGSSFDPEIAAFNLRYSF